MIYLSQLLGQRVYMDDKPFGKIVDMAIFESKDNPPVSKFEIQTPQKKLTVSPQAIQIKQHRFTIAGNQIPLLPYDHKDFYLAEDLLDKQVIDVDGRRLVRVNDVVLDQDIELKVTGIDVGASGIFRRLGLGMLPISSKILPWQIIEAFDYQTGNVHIKLKQTSLNSMHPAEIADILEEAGAKERLGIVDILEPKQAAMALEEADEETQTSILENLKPNTTKAVVDKMHLTELADILREINPLKVREVETALGDEKARVVRKILSFSNDTAGSLMHMSFLNADGEETVKRLVKTLEERKRVPETVIVTNGGGKFSGVVSTKDLLIVDKVAQLKDVIEERKFVYPTTPLDKVLKLLAQYNLRIVPVVDTEKKPIGIVLIDDILRMIEQQQDESL